MYHFVKGDGIYLYDQDGKAYIDLISGIAVTNIGHSNKKVVQAIKKQSQRFMHQMVYGEYVISPQVKLAKLLAKHLPPELQSFYFLNSGSEAVEAGLKLAKKYTGRRKIVAMRNAYHGSTTGALSLMSNAYYAYPFKPLLPDVYFCEFNNTSSLDTIDHNTAAVVIEPIQAEAGYIPATAAFLQAVKDRCNEVGCLMILDEIQTGIGRTGKLFAFQDYGIQPHILLSAKALGAGMPLSAMIASKEIMDSLSDRPILGHITTFGGHPVSCAAARAGLKYLLKHNIMDGVEQKEQTFRKLLQHPKIKGISGKGLLLAIELEDFATVEYVIDHCYRNGVIIDWFLYQAHALRIAPPLIIDEEQINTVCHSILTALNEYRG